MKKINVIQVGTGHDHAAGTMMTLRSLGDYYNVIGVCEPDNILKKTAEENPAYSGLKFFDLDEALNMNDAEAVFIESEESKLIYYAQLFADSGYPIHMDKPGGTDIDKFERLIYTMKNQNLAFQMGYMYRYNKSVQKSLQWVKNGALGDIFSVEAHMSVRHDKEKRKWLSQFKGGMMYFLGCHLVDIVYMFCGYPDEIMPLNCSTGIEGIQCEDYGFALYKYKNGVSFVKTNAAEVNGFARRQIVITGSKGSIEINPIEIIEKDNDLLRRSKIKYTNIDNSKDNIWTDMSNTEITDVFSRYGDMLIDFAEIVRNKKKNPFSYDYELKMHKMFLKSCGIAI